MTERREEIDPRLEEKARKRPEGDTDQTITAPTPPQGRDSFEPGEFEEKRRDDAPNKHH